MSGYDCWGCSPRTYYVRRPVIGLSETYVLIPFANGLSTPSIAVDSLGSPHLAMAEVIGNVYTEQLFYASERNGWMPVLVIGGDHGSPTLGVGRDGYGHFVCMTGASSGIQDVLQVRSSKPLFVPPDRRAAVGLGK